MLRTVAVAAAILILPLLSLVAPGWLGPVAAAALWGLGLMACFCGWGSWTARRLAPTLEPDLGLRAVWGFALTVVVGGPLCLLSLARRPVLLAWATAGIALCARDAARALAARLRAPRRPRSSFWSWSWSSSWPWAAAEALVLAGLLAALAFMYVGAATRNVPNPSDDLVAYLPFVRKILQTGTFLDPFSVRRMAAYGGQSFLQALTLLGAEDDQIQLFDQGICSLLLAGLVLGVSRDLPRASRVLVDLLLLMLLMLPEVRINSASEISGAVGFLAAFRTMTAAEKTTEPDGWRAALLVALPLAAVCTFRQNYMMVAFFIAAAALLPRGEASRAARVRRFARLGVLVAACLLPWAALAFRSNHTFLFPLFPGNYDSTYAITGASTAEARFRFYLGALFHDEPIRTMPLFILAAPAVARAAKQRPLLGLWLGTIVGFAFLALSLPDADNFTIARYGFAFEVALAAAIGVAATELATFAPGRPSSVVALFVVVAAIGVQITGSYASTVRSFSGALRRMVSSHAGPPPLATSGPDVRKMQSAIPPGERVLVLIERPYLLDFARNPIALLDIPGAASPRRALRLLDGPENIAAYLLAEGYRYVAFASPDAAQNDLYKRQHWKAALTSRQRIWRNSAPFYLATFNAFDHFVATRQSLYSDGHLEVVDLAVRR